MTQNEDILTTVIENGRLEHWTADELEVEIQFECGERGLSDEETAEAVAFALAHTALRAPPDAAEREKTMNTAEIEAQIAARNARCEEIEIAMGQSRGNDPYKALVVEKRALVDEIEVLNHELYGERFSWQMDETRIAAARARLGL